MSPSNNSASSAAKPGLIALGRADAEAARAAGIEAFELADAWAWLDMNETAKAQAKADGGANPDSPIDPALKAWAAGRVVVVPEIKGWGAAEKKSIKTMAKALRVQTPAEAVIHTIWGA